jgi:hypothetical protein
VLTPRVDLIGARAADQSAQVAALWSAELEAAEEAELVEFQHCQVVVVHRIAPAAVEQMARVRPVVTVWVVARQLTGAVVRTLRWVRLRLIDAGGGVCLPWAYPLTCRVACTLPIRANPEKPCGVNYRKNKFARFSVVE